MNASLHVAATATFLVAMTTGCGSGNDASHGANEPEKNQTNADSVRDPTTIDPAMAIIEAAIKAHGGEGNFAKGNVGRIKLEIDGSYLPGISGKVTTTDYFDFPSRLARIVEAQGDGENVRIKYVFDGKSGWMQTGKRDPIELPPRAATRNVFPIENLNRLIECRDGGFTLSVLPENKLPDAEAQCIRVERNGGWEGDLYFDKQTNLLAASVKSLINNETGEPMSVETYYLNYKDIDGLKLPMSSETIFGDHREMKADVVEIEFMKQIAPETFAKPFVEN